jgi:hypothetical protein
LDLKFLCELAATWKELQIHHTRCWDADAT